MLLQDFAFIPGLFDDYGHYLFLTDTDKFWKEEVTKDWRKVITGADSDLISFVDLVDRELGICCMAEQLVKEGGKYRIFLCPNRVSQYCPLSLREDMECFCARLVLSIITKYRLKEYVHTEYLWVGNVRYDRGSRQDRESDVRMIHKVKAVLSGTDFLQCDERFLSLNPKAEYISFFTLPPSVQKQKMQLAEKLKDVGIIWQCGLSRRKKFRKQKVFSYDDPEFMRLLSEYIPPSKFTVVEKMMRLGETEDQVVCFPPASHPIWQNDLFTMDLDKLLFVDFETDFQKCIYMFGYTSEREGYRVEWADDLCPPKELDLMHRIFEITNNHHSRGGKIVYFFAEDRFWRERCTFHKLDSYKNLFSSGIDLYQIFEKGPFLVRGSFNFKLKTLAKSLFELSKIPISQPEGCADGSESVAIARRWFHLKQEEDRDILNKYNRFDCDVLLEITRFLREY